MSWFPICASLAISVLCAIAAVITHRLEHGGIRIGGFSIQRYQTLDERMLADFLDIETHLQTSSLEARRSLIREAFLSSMDEKDELKIEGR